MNFDASIRAHCQPMQPISTDVEPQLAKLIDIRAVAFDVYGTLLISGSGDVGLTASTRREQSFIESAKSSGLPQDLDATNVIALLDQGIRESHETSKANGIDFPEVDIVDVWRKTLSPLLTDDETVNGWKTADWQAFSLNFELRVNPVWPMPGTNSILEWLRKRSTVLGIVSNAQFFTPVIIQSLLERSLDSLGFQSELNYFSYEHLQAKPGTFLYEALRDMLGKQGIAANQTLYVGNDMLNDVMAAASVGFRTALFAGDRRSLRWREGDARVRNVEPDIVLTDLQQLIDCLL